MVDLDFKPWNVTDVTVIVRELSGERWAETIKAISANLGIATGIVQMTKDNLVAAFREEPAAMQDAFKCLFSTGNQLKGFSDLLFAASGRILSAGSVIAVEAPPGAKAG